MTIAEIAAQMDTAQTTVLALSALAVVCGLAVLIARFIGSDNISAALVISCCADTMMTNNERYRQQRFCANCGAAFTQEENDERSK